MRGVKFPKPALPLRIERHERKVRRAGIERQAKQDVKARDHHQCRWPTCQFRRISQPLDAAHVMAAGMGGDPTSARMRTENLVTICRTHHQGPESLHSGDLKIEALTPAGADGPLQFLRRGEDGVFYVVAEETAIGITRRD